MKRLCLAVLFAGYAALAGAAPGTTTSTSLSLSLLHDMDTIPGILFGVTDGLRFTLGSGVINLEAVNYPVSTFDFLSLQGRGGNLGVGTTTDSGEKMEINGSLRITAATFPTTGKGLELQFDPVGDAGWVFAYNRNTSAYYPVNFKGNSDTTTALATTPTQCTGGQFATGIAASGNANCATVVNIVGTSSNITAYTINQNLGTTDSPTFNHVYGSTITAGCTATGTVTAGDGRVCRSSTTGALYFGAGDNYIYYDGAQFVVNHPFTVNWGTNIVYRCTGGTNAGVLSTTNTNPLCTGGSWTATSLTVD